MTVVSNTSPLCYLILIEYESILPDLFGDIIIPESVRNELSHSEAPDAVQKWIKMPPEWLVVRDISGETDVDLSHLHAGERDAIFLAESLEADLLIVDERAAREAAEIREIRYTGLLGLLSHAASCGLLDLQTAIARLRHTTFRASPRLLKTILDRHRADQ